MNQVLDELKSLVVKLSREKYPDANSIFLAGSVIRGESTSTSDLDIVVIYPSLPNAYRESYRFGGWPIEAFVHDPQTLKYFFHSVDAPTGVPSLAAMVSEGIELPFPTALSQSLKQLANEFLQAGPPGLTAKSIDNSRYAISDLVEDLREPRTAGEMVAIATQLYGAIADHFFRSQGLWSAKGKTIPRRLRKIDPVFAARFETAFDAVFTRQQTAELIALAENVLSAHGGFLFEGHRFEAPPEWRSE